MGAPSVGKRGTSKAGRIGRGRGRRGRGRGGGRSAYRRFSVSYSGQEKEARRGSERGHAMDRNTPFYYGKNGLWLPQGFRSTISRMPY
jgi:hypothetical protein